MRVVNKIRCNKCGDIIESISVHDFKCCKCGAVAVDGGHDYLRRCGNREDWEELSEVVDDRSIVEQLSKINQIDEETGILELEDIVRKCSKVFEKYEVSFCYLFGSYAKGKATPVSDVDLLITANVKGLKFYGLVEEIRTALHKKTDVLDINQLKNNIELTEEIFKDGIKIYGYTETKD